MDDTPKIKTGRFFAEFAVRMVAFWFDLFVVVFLSQIIKDYVLVPAGLGFRGIGAVIPFVGFTYFLASWSSPMRATPMQWLFRMRVVDKNGETLSPARAALRAFALFALFFAAHAVLGALADPFYVVLAIAAYVALFLAAVTVHRQAGHDLLVGSIVVNKTALKAFDEFGSQRRPSAWKMIGDGLMLAVPVAMLLFVAQMQQQRDIMYRTQYAVEQTERLKTEVGYFYEFERRWPANELELGAPARGDYPDGGYYELEANGVIRISFEVKPELVRGQIVLSPAIDEEGVSWQCHQEGDIRQSHLPVACRDPEREDR